MISRKVACAIMLLNELYYTPPDKRTGNKALGRTALMTCSAPDSRTFRRVMQQLHIGKYINSLSTSVILTCDPAKVTIYDLFVTLHGGIPLGEEQKPNLEPSHYTEKGYRSIERLQDDVIEVSRKYFECRTVASMTKVKIKKSIYINPTTNK